MATYYYSFRTVPIVWLLIALVVEPTPARAFSITEPKDFSVHQSGNHIPVVLDVGGIAGVTKVNYYWYGEKEDMLQEFADQRLALVATRASDPPFGGSIRVPREAIGTYRLLVVAEQGGRQSDVESLAIFDEIMIQVEPNAKLLEIDFQTEKPLRLGRSGGVRVYDQLDFLGKTFDLPVIGRFSDGTVRSIRNQSAGTTYRSADERVITVSRDGVLRVVGNGETVLTVKNRDREASLDILVQVDDQPNQPPLANAGTTQSVFSGERVTLNGLASFDPDGGSLQYHWSQVLGSKIPLLDPYSAEARFLAPFVVEERTFRFKLKVTDILGADSPPSYVDILVSP